MNTNQLTEIMKKLNLTNQDLATIAGVSYRSVMAWKSGNHAMPDALSYLLMAIYEGLITDEWLVNKIENNYRNKM